MFRNHVSQFFPVFPKHIYMLNVNKTQLLVCSEKNDLEIFALWFEELGKALNPKGCRMEQGKTLGILTDYELKFDDMISKVCQAGYLQLS